LEKLAGICRCGGKTHPNVSSIFTFLLFNDVSLKWGVSIGYSIPGHSI
jgi:hypothetical protein